MAQDPTITVIIATYNSCGSLNYALRSLLRQDYSNFEAWIIGDACTDDSERIVAQFGDPRLNWFNLSRRVGFQSGPNNEGLRRARGRYIAYLGHDDLWFPNHLTELLSVIEEKKADFVHSVAALVGPEGICDVNGIPGVARSYAVRWVHPSSWMHRRDVIESCGNWPLNRVESGTLVDFAYQRQLFLAGKRFASCAQLTVIKFPSAFWRLYALHGDYPQHAYSGQLEQDSQKLQVSLYREIAYRFGREHENAFILPALLKVRQGIYRSIKEWYGIDRWPLRQILKWRLQRIIKSYDLRRGLSKSDPKSDREPIVTNRNTSET